VPAPNNYSGWSGLRLAVAAHVDPKILRDLLFQRRRSNMGTVQAVSKALDLTLAEVIRFLGAALVA
jgi:hypothetical protein